KIAPRITGSPGRVKGLIPILVEFPIWGLCPAGLAWRSANRMLDPSDGCTMTASLSCRDHAKGEFMKRKLLTVLLVLVPTAGVFAQQPKREDLQATVKKLEKEIADLRGLAFKNPVVAKIIARPADAAKGIQGYYSLTQKALFIYDDIAGN